MCTSRERKIHNNFIELIQCMSFPNTRYKQHLFEVTKIDCYEYAPLDCKIADSGLKKCFCLFF